MTIYSIDFTKKARKEWDKLGYDAQIQFKKKLEKVRSNPHVLSAKLHNMKDCYKIKLREEGYRLVYCVIDAVLVIEIIAIGRRDGDVYEEAKERLN